MREIQFRGKRIDNGEWVYGYLIGNDVIVGEIVELNDECFITEFWYKVDPETVGQYTGLKDKNGKDVYEGDMLQVGKEYSGSYSPTYVTFEDCSFRHQVSHMHNPVVLNDAIVTVREVIGNIYEDKQT